MNPERINLASLAPYFADEPAAWRLLEDWRWPSGPVCPHCGVIDHAYFLKPRKNATRKTSTGAQSYRRLWKCAECRKQFSVLVGTIFEDSKIPIHKWLMAYHLMSAAKNGIAAKELERMLDISYKSAWFMAHRIRYSLERSDNEELMTGTVASDETYVGGHLKNMPRQKRRETFAEGQLSNKTAVVTLVSREGEARSQAVERVDGNNLGIVLAQNVDQSATLVSDENTQYKMVSPLFAGHETVNHSQNEYARPDGITTNAVEGFFSQLKRSIDGTHHHVSKRHLNRYLAEFDYRYNTRKMTDGERTVKAVRQTARRRLMYDKVVSRADR